MKTVLVVDDDPDIRELITWKLSQAGYGIVTAADGEEAMAMVRGNGIWPDKPPDLVLLDWMMPKQTGIEVCNLLRADPATAQIPVILLTLLLQRKIVAGMTLGAVKG